MADRHHYVSQFHLRHFVDPASVNTRDPWVWVGDVATRAVKRRAPKNLAWSRGMFDGPGGLSDSSAKLEEHLANEIEPAAAHALSKFSSAPRGKRGDLPPQLMRYVAWAAARNLPMAGMFQDWAAGDQSGNVVEPPPSGWDKIKDRPRPHSLEHPELGVKEYVPAEEVFPLLEAGWKLKLHRDDLLECMHLQAWYFQVRFFPRLRWIVLDAPEDGWFVIGDRPVVWGFDGDVACKPSMLRHPNAQLLAPLTRSIALFAHNPAGSCPDSITPGQVNYVMAGAAVEWIAGAEESTVTDALSSVGVA